MKLARFLVFLGGVVVAVLFAALIGPFFIDWTNYRADFEREASRILGQNVTVLGNADARLLPFPSVTFSDVRVGGVAGAASAEEGPMMRIARFSMDAELAPFLSGEIRIFDMRIEEPDVRVELSDDGSLDWAARAPNPDGGLPDSTVVLENISVIDGVITIADLQNGRRHTLSDLNAIVSATTLLGPWRVEGTGAINGETGAFSVTTGERKADGSIRVRTRLLPDSQPVSVELEGDALIEDLKPKYAGSFTLQVLNPADTVIAGSVSPPGGPVALRGTGLFEADNERLRVSEYRLEVGAREDPYVVTGEATIDTGENPDFLLIADGQQIDVDRLQAAEDAAQSGVAPVEGAEEEVRILSMAERIETFRGIIEQIPIPDLPGRVSVVLPAVIAGSTTLRDVSIDAQPAGDHWQVDRFAAALPGRTQVEATGALRVGEDYGFKGGLVVASNQPSGFAAWLTTNVHPTIRALDAAGFSADVDLSRDMQRFDNLELAVGPATLTGQFERNVRPERPALSLDMNGDAVDLDTIRALLGLFTGEGGESRLTGHDIAARFKADRFSAFDVQMAGVDTAISLQNGLLDVERIAVADIAGAAIEGRGVFSDVFAEPQGRASLTLSAGRMGPLFSLMQTRAGTSVDFSHLRDNASLFDGTDLALDLQLGSARDTGAPGRTSGFDLQVNGESGGSTVAFTLGSDGPVARIVDGTIWSDGFDATLDADNTRTDILLAQAGLPVLPFDIGGPATLAARFSGSVAEAAVDLSMRSRTSSASAKGTVSFDGQRLSGGDMNVALSSGDLEPYLLLGGVGIPGFGSGLPVEVTADLAISEAAYQLTGLTGVLAGNPYQGELTIDRTTPSPALSGELAFGSLDAGWFAEAIYGEPMISLSDGEWSSDDFPPSATNGFSATLALTADQAFLGYGEAAEGLSATMALGDGELRFSEVRADWFGGRLEGNMNFGNGDGVGRMSIQAQLADADLGAILGNGPPGGTVQAFAQGRGDLSLALEGSGKSPMALVSSLTGSGVASVEALELKGLDAEALPGILKAADAEGFEITESNVAQLAEDAIGQGSFQVDTASVPFTIAGGTLRAASIRLQNADATIAGDTQMRLAEETLDARFSIEFDAGDESLAGAAPALAMRFSGPLTGLERDIDATAMSNFLSLRAYERERRRVETVQAALLEKQRLRREVSLIRARLESREEARLRAAEEEEARLRRAAEAAEIRAREAQERAALEAEERERARAAAEAEAAARAELQAAERARAEAEAAAAREAREREAEADEGDTSATPEAQAPSTSEAATPDQPQPSQAAPTGLPGFVPPFDPNAQPAAEPEPSLPTLDFNGIPGALPGGPID